MPAIHGDIKNMSTVSMERLETDTQNFKENIDPLIGGTDIIIFAFGADINNGGEYTGNEKFEYLKSQGYDYYCNVDSNKYFVQMTDEYFRMEEETWMDTECITIRTCWQICLT